MKEKDKGKVIAVPNEDIIAESQFGPTYGQVILALVRSGELVAPGATRINIKKAYRELRKIGFFDDPTPSEAPGL